MENCPSSGWWCEEESDWPNWNHDSSFPETTEYSSSSSSFLMVPSSSSTSCHFHGDTAPLSHPLNRQTTIPELGDDTKTPSAASNKSHSLAEKRRRDRINAQLASLRKVIPKSDKMDKAALLGSVIEHVKDLKRKASEISPTLLVPTETDDVSIDMDVHHAPPSKNCIFIRASLCCDDRPELYAELIRVLKGLKLTTVRADITSVGGRTRNILVLCSNNSEAEGVSVTTIRNSLKVVLSRIASASMAAGCRSIRSRRQRFFFP